MAYKLMSTLTENSKTAELQTAETMEAITRYKDAVERAMGYSYPDAKITRENGKIVYHFNGYTYTLEIVQVGDADGEKS